MKLSDLDLNKLATFLAVAEAGGVGKAAAQLGRTSSAVSQSIGALERALGHALFDRAGKQLVLTRGGQALRESMAGCRQLLQQGLASLTGQAGPSGVVRLGAYLGFPRQRLTALLLAFGRRHPRASVRVVYAPGRELSRRLQDNRLDYVLSFGTPAPAASRIASTRLSSQELVLVSRPPCFARGFSLAELERTPIVDYYASDPLIERWLLHHYPRHAPRLGVRYWAATIDLVLELLLEGAGAGVLPRQVALGALGAGKRGGRGRLVELGPKGKPMIDTIWLDEPRGAHRDETQRAFRDVLLEVLRDAV